MTQQVIDVGTSGLSGSGDSLYEAGNKIKTESFSIKNIILKSLNKLDFKKNTIIKPIYISNNIILN